MSRSERLSDLKSEIRSVLITFQNGCYLSEFCRAYQGLSGRLPSRDFGYNSDIDLLLSMPEVVQVFASGYGEPRLQGIADENTKHIKMMVDRQKKTKSRPARPTRFNRFYEAYSAPRFSERPKISKPIQYVSKSFQVSDSKSKPFPSNSNISNLTKTVSVSKPKPTMEIKPISPMEEVVSLVKEYKNGIPLTEILYEYDVLYKKSFSLSSYGFTSIEECIKDISELDIVYIDNIPYAIHESESFKFSKRVPVASAIFSNTNLKSNVEQSSDISSKSNSIQSRSSNSINSSSVPQSIFSKLQEVAKRIPHSVWASEFPGTFEEVTGTTLDLHSLGYNCLADFIDEIPEIFLRKSIVGNKKDYFIYPATLELNDREGAASSEVGASLIESVILKLKQILQANPEGIKVRHLEHIYKINCNGSLSASDLGFRDLETFLSSVKERVPLRFETHNGDKTIHLLKLSDFDIELPYNSPQACQDEAIPFDAAFPNFEFKKLSLPKSYDFSKYIPVYVSEIINPSHLYIHIQDDEATKAFGKLADDFENFYNGEQSKLYLMKNVHIQVGAACIAFWPADQHWYRAQILSIPSMDKVRVHYIDYGTRNVIPKSLLRYIKKDYTTMPVQALRCCLSYLRPPNNATAWSQQCGQRLRELCHLDITLMAKIDEIQSQDVYSIVLCDTNGDSDVHINDVLKNEGLAEYGLEEPPKTIQPPHMNSISIPVPPIEYQNIDPLKALQAQCLLQTFASIVPTFAQNENYLKLLQQISMFCPNTFPMQQNPSLPFNPYLATPNPNQFSTGMSDFMNSNLTASYPSTSFLQGGANPFYPNLMTPQSSSIAAASTVDVLVPPIRAPTPPGVLVTAKSAGFVPIENKNGESDIFEDDDDDIFEELCQKLSVKTTRFVKRVILGDGYKIHIVNIHSKAYASSGDISQLIWNNKEADYLFRRLQLKEVDFPTHNLSEDGNEDLFHQLERFNVKGVQKTSGFKSSILLYPLKVVIKILNVFGHPSISLRTKLTDEIMKFNPDDSVWKEFSAPEIEPDEDENLLGVTDDDKIEKLCLYDLLAMKEGINCRRLSMMQNNLNKADNGKYVDEISKLEQMQQKVLQRIEEIKDICILFA